MTFDTLERSLAKGEPILLFDFALGLTHFLYTTADRPITYLSRVFQPVAIRRSNPIKSSDVRRQMMTITAPRDIDVADVFAGWSPSIDMLLTITSLHYTDPDAQGIVDWIGRVTSPAWKGSYVEITCEPVYTSVQTAGLRRRWTINCPHVHYGAGCALATGPFKATSTIASVAGSVVNIPAFATVPTGLSYLGGWLEWDSGNGYFERRTIEEVSGGVLTLAYGSPDLVPGLSVNGYLGCDHTTRNCDAFGNIANYGGAAFTPNKNPMDGLGTPIY